nr:MAG TPA: hypothetical protein [Caudoviricetes sp.]
MPESLRTAVSPSPLSPVRTRYVRNSRACSRE